MHPWWKYVDKQPHMKRYVSALMAVLMGGQPKGLQCNFDSIKCKICSSGARDSPAHILFECTALQETRSGVWTELSRMWTLIAFLTTWAQPTNTIALQLTQLQMEFPMPMVKTDVIEK